MSLQFFSFSPFGTYSAPVIFFHSRRWTKLIKNKLCKKSPALFTVCQFALSAVGCSPFLLFLLCWLVGFLGGCQSTFVRCPVWWFAGCLAVGLCGVFLRVAASCLHFLSRFCLLPFLRVRQFLFISPLGVRGEHKKSPLKMRRLILKFSFFGARVKQHQLLLMHYKNHCSKHIVQN